MTLPFDCKGCESLRERLAGLEGEVKALEKLQRDKPMDHAHDKKQERSPDHIARSWREFKSLTE